MTPTLSPRLRAVADLVLPGRAAADIGCDHAQLAAWWVASGRVPSAIASDVRPGPLEQARKNLALSRITHVELRRGSGLSTLRPGEVSTIAIAGMGGPLMLRLLEESRDVAQSAGRIILQPNTAWEQVRSALAAQQIRLDAETLTEDGGHTYLTLAYDPNVRGVHWSDADVLLGPRLRRDRPPSFDAWLEQRRSHLGTLQERLARELGPGHPRVQQVIETRAQLDVAALEPIP